jgi:hypothetical protein
METGGQLHKMVTLLPEKSPQYHPDRRRGGPNNTSSYTGVESSLLPLLGIEPKDLRCPAHSLVTAPTTLYRSQKAVGIMGRYVPTISSSSQANCKIFLGKRITVSGLQCLTLCPSRANVLSIARRHAFRSVHISNHNSLQLV